MRIGIDACCWSNQRGFGRFTRELVTALLPLCPRHEVVLVVDRETADQCQLPEGTPRCVVETREQPTRAASFDGSRSPADLWRMYRAVAQLRPDVFLFPAVYSFFPIPRGIPTTVVFHDAIAERHPSLIFSGRKSRFLWNAKTWLALRQADRLVTVSESARTEIAQAFSLSTRRICVISEGPAAAFRPLEDDTAAAAVVERYDLPRATPLLLYVGGISPHKNLDGLFRGLAHMRQQSPEPWHAVLVGDYENDSFLQCHDELVRLRRELDLTDRITFVGFVSVDDLVALYNAATVLVSPAFMEGFGLPAVEAMACGLPVAASNRGSLPEVVGSAGLLFDPDDHEDIAATVTRLLDDASLRARLRAEGLQRAQRFSWQSAAEQTVQILEDVTDGTAKTA